MKIISFNKDAPPIISQEFQTDLGVKYQLEVIHAVISKEYVIFWAYIRTMDREYTLFLSEAFDFKICKYLSIESLPNHVFFDHIPNEIPDNHELVFLVDQIHFTEGSREVTSLNISKSYTKSVKFLAHFNSLTELKITLCNVPYDLKTILQLDNLTSLQITSTKSACSTSLNQELMVLSKLTHLTSLSLDLFKTDGLYFLKHLTGLSFLSLTLSNSPDFTPLESLQGLNSLTLKLSKTCDLTPLSKLKNLRSLTLIALEACDLTPIGDLDHLTDLTLETSEAINIHPILRLKKLLSLRLEAPNIKSFGQWDCSSNIQDISIKISTSYAIDISFLSFFNHLKHLSLELNLLSAAPISSLKNLESLHIKTKEYKSRVGFLVKHSKFTLQRLSPHCSEYLQSSPSVPVLNQLTYRLRSKKLSLSNLKQIKTIQIDSPRWSLDFVDLPHLEGLLVDGPPKTLTLINIGTLTSLNITPTDCLLINNVSELTQIKIASKRECENLQVNISNCANLKGVSFEKPSRFSTKIKSINITQCPNISDLNVFIRDHVKLSYLPSLAQVQINSDISSIHIEECKSLLALNDISADTIILKKLDTLSQFSLEEQVAEKRATKNILLEDLPRLKSLDLQTHPMSSIILNDLPSLIELTLDTVKNIQLDTLKIKTLSLHGEVDNDTLKTLLKVKTLENLFISSCENISDITPIFYLPNLISLSLTKLKSVFDISQIPQKHRFETLELTAVAIIQGVEHLSKFTGMKSLSLDYDLKDISFLTSMSLLEILSFSSSSIESTPSLKKTPKLKTLTLKTPSLKDTSFLQNLQKLEKLTITCANISSIPDCIALQNLLSLDFRTFENNHLAYFRDSPLKINLHRNLKEIRLDISSSAKSKDKSYYIKDRNILISVSDMTKLEEFSTSGLYINELTIERCPQLRFLCRPIGNKLSLEDTPKIDTNTLPPKSFKYIKMPRLLDSTHIDFHDAHSLKNIHFPAPLETIEYLDIEGTECEDISFLKNLPNLSKAFLGVFEGYNEYGDGASGPSNIKDISHIKHLKSLNVLSLNHCELITDLTPLRNLTALEDLNVSGCKLITDLTPLQNLTALKELNLSGCELIIDLRPLTQLTSLERLELEGCGDIHTLEPLMTLPQLKELTWTSKSATSEVLLNAALLRHDLSTLEENSEAWLQHFSLSKSPESFFRRLSEAGEQLQSASLLTSLAERARAFSSQQLNLRAWRAWAQKVLTLTIGRLDCFSAALCELRDLDALRGRGAGVIGVIGVMGQLKKLHDKAEWREVLTLVEEALEGTLDDEVQRREIAPAAATFYAACGDDERVRAWLERATHPETPTWRDRVLLALVEWCVTHDAWSEAQHHLAQIETHELRDQAHLRFGRALLTHNPTQVALQHLNALIDPELKQALALELCAHTALYQQPQAVAQLVLALQHDQDSLSTLLNELMTHNPDAVGSLSALFGWRATQSSTSAQETAQDALAELLSLDLSTLTPLKALTYLSELQERFSPTP